jgi:hypothetical protein
MTINSFIRGAWQAQSNLEVADSHKDVAVVKNVTVRVWRAIDVVFTHINADISFTDSSPSEVPFVDFVLPGPEVEFPARVSIFLTHMRDNTPYFSQAMMEIFTKTIRVHNFPFYSSQEYNLNAQFFYTP